MKLIDIDKLTKEFIYNIEMDTYKFVSYNVNKGYTFMLGPVIEDSNDNFQRYVLGEFDIKICKANLVRLIFENLGYNNFIYTVTHPDGKDVTNYELLQYNALDILYKPEKKSIDLNITQFSDEYLKRYVKLDIQGINPYPFEYIFEKDSNENYNYYWQQLLNMGGPIHDDIILHNGVLFT
jgi:hypothetical protein